MWKYVDKKQCNEFLLSLHLLDNRNDKDYLKTIYSISNNIENNYTLHKIKKSNGKVRIIYEPSDTLKHIQRKILVYILNNKSISSYARAYKEGISLKDNAIVHVNKPLILKLDIKNFFDNIKFVDVYNSCFSIEYFPVSVGMLFTHLCTYKGYVPQGAPTSAYISNLVLKRFDEILGKWCRDRNISYTRYSDDMTFSGDFLVSEVIDEVRRLLFDFGFKLNNDKIRVIRNNNRQLVTGIVVNKKTQVSVDYRKKIRQEIYYIKKFGLKSHLQKINSNLDEISYLNNLYGRVLFVLQVNNYDKEFFRYERFLYKLKNKF